MHVPLIFPNVVAYKQLDLSGSSYDHVFREPATTDDGTQLGTDGRAETAEVRIKAQLDEKYFERLRMMASGDAPEGEIIVTHHRKDLASADLIDSEGRPTIKKGDRFVGVYPKRGSTKLFEVRNPPGLFVIEVRPSGWGLNDSIDLWDVVLVARDTGSEG